MNFMSGSSSRPGFSQDHHQITPPMPPFLHHFNYHHHDGGGDEDQLSRRTGGGGVEAGSSASAHHHHPHVMEREHMFDKVVTPSDVGKLNRLVIPKQHAEKYFPLDSSTNEKGLLLNFEDRNGKPWRFRYSYWNSSQSYVMTKGWSRFVKEKKLDAGDIVSFQRGMGEVGKDRLFIDWRRRPDAPPPTLSIPHHQFSFHRSNNIHPWNPLFFHPTPPPSTSEYSHFLHHHYPPPYAAAYSHTVVNGNPCPPGSIVYLRSAPVGGGTDAAPQAQVEEQKVFESVPVVQGKAAAKRLRLFGVNMDCPIISETTDHEYDIDVLSHSCTIPLQQQLPSNFDDSSLHLRPHEDYNKGKASMSLDLDI